MAKIKLDFEIDGKLNDIYEAIANKAGIQGTKQEKRTWGQARFKRLLNGDFINLLNNKLMKIIDGKYITVPILTKND